MKFKVEFFEERNGERYYLALADFLPCTFNATTKRGITQGYRRVIEKCRRTLYMHFGAKTIKSEAYAIYDKGTSRPGAKVFDKPFATANVELYF